MNLPQSTTVARPPFRQLAAFTLIELLVVITIIGILAGFVVGLAPLAGKRMKDARVKAELTALIGAIESYKAKYGVYPPDNYDPVRRLTNPVTNSLFYELTGVLVDNSSALLLPIDDNVTINPDDFKRYFGREGVLNSAPRIPAANPVLRVKNDREQKKLLLRRELKPSHFAEVFSAKTAPGYVPLEVLAVGFSTDATGKKGAGLPWPANLPSSQQPIPTNPGLNPWRYVSTSPTNNPGRFDLWAEIRDRDKTNIIGNW